jgi:hypothetical protein
MTVCIEVGFSLEDKLLFQKVKAMSSRQTWLWSVPAYVF